MKEYYIVGDVNRNLIWYGPYATMRFSKPGLTKDTPMLFETFEQAYQECERINKGYKFAVLAIAKMYFFKNCPAEKKENVAMQKIRFNITDETLKNELEIGVMPKQKIVEMAFCMVKLLNQDVWLN